MPEYKNNYLLILLSFIFIGTIIMSFGTRWGIGITVDSVEYIDLSRHLINGDGFITSYLGTATSETHFPPLYPMILAAMGMLGVEPMSGARLLNVVLLGLNSALIGYIIYQYCDKSFCSSIIASVIMIISPAMLDIHSMAWTEPLFNFCGILGLYLLTSYFRTYNMKLIVLSSMMISLAFISRYVGVTLLITGVIGIILLSSSSKVKKVMDIIIFGAIGSFPMAIFVIRNHLVAGKYTSRKMEFHPFSYDHFKSALNTFLSWGFPGNDRFTVFAFQHILLGVILSVFIGILLWIICYLLFCKMRRDGIISTIYKYRLESPLLFLIFVFMYTSFLIVSISFFDFSTPMDNRILSPVYISSLILMSYVGFYIKRNMCLSER